MKSLMIIWSDSHSLGIPILDEQHHRFSSLINTLFHFMPTPGEDILFPMLDMIEAYTRIHFLTEEQLFVTTSYPYCASNIASHVQFMRAVKKHCYRKKTGDPTDLLQCMKVLWINHMNGEDRSFPQYVINHFDIKSCTS